MPGHTAAVAGATMWSVAERLLCATTAGFEGSSTKCRVSSEAEGFEADPPFIIHYCCYWSVIITYTAWRVTFSASHTDRYPWLATNYQQSVDLLCTVLRVPIPYGWVLSVEERSVDLSGLTCVFLVWLALSTRTGVTSDGGPTRRCFYMCRSGLARTHCTCLPLSSLPRTITSCYCTVAC